jgi:DNA polymerase V
MLVYEPDLRTRWRIPLYLQPVSAGFPSPADDYLEGRVDLNRYLIKHPAATFFVRVTGDSMIAAGIHPGDLLVVDRAIPPTSGRIVIAVIHGELTVKRIRYQGDRLYLVPENPKYSMISIDPDMELHVWGVVTNVIHPL